MGLSDIAKRDLARFTSNSDEFGVEIILTEPIPGAGTITVNGYTTHHHMAFTMEGEMTNSKVSSVAISMENLTGYPYINAKGEVDFNNHLVKYDSTNWKVLQFYPDLKLSLIVLILESWEA